MDKKTKLSEEIIDFLRENDIRSFNAWDDDVCYRIILDGEGNVVKSMILNAEQWDGV